MYVFTHIQQYLIHFSLYLLFTYTETTEFYPLSLHDALPIPLAPARRGPPRHGSRLGAHHPGTLARPRDRKSTRLNSSHTVISYAVFCLKKKKIKSLSLLYILYYQYRNRHQVVYIAKLFITYY